MKPANYKPIGGVESCSLYATDAVAATLFSGSECSVTLSAEPLAVELLDDASFYEEEITTDTGGRRVKHTLTLVAARTEAQAWLDEEFVERVASEGVVATVKLCDGRELLVGYSAHFAEEQPLYLASLSVASGRKLLDTPQVVLTLVSHDTELSHEIVE